eukprot:CAMPEP_0178945612 /NCGR_PEP_ID=MMETSP0789-20121207/3829_1 /TAXON_ID=3005 /ORGANISM="Rhizosolenia setigera, Strain CCMP 1694" /LENGTH=434 /DNA_ID=CAMNT_0020625517 /DNA_START=298 /DNA_END=1599 /DNA_ORIENTATION=-
MQLLYESCNLSMLAYNYYKTTDESGNPKDFTRSRSDYDKYEQFLEGYDEVIFASLDGRCFVSFRGTDSSNSEDLISNVGLTYDQISPLYDSSSECTVSSAPRFLGGGYSQVFWNALLIKNEKGLTIEDELNNCIMENCPTREEDDECVILTGHSQGGSVANIAAIYFSHLNPVTVTFGQVNSVRAGCDSISPERYYRIVNTVSMASAQRPIQNYEYEAIGGIANLYDFAPFFSSQRADEYGHLFITAGGDTGMLYLGLNGKITDYGFSGVSVLAHDQDLYNMRMKYLLDSFDQVEVPLYIETKGFQNGTPCTHNIECYNKSCVNGVCEGLGSCEECTLDSHCASGFCSKIHYWDEKGFCSSTDSDIERTDNDCYCNSSDECFPDSHCFFVDLHDPLGKGKTCQPKKELSEPCSSNDNCASGYCDWLTFQCAESS